MTRSILWVGAALVMAVPAQAGAQVFHSHQAANLPTAATLAADSWLFEISHRFDTPFSEGADALWGLDGPVRNRLGLTYAPTGSLMLQLQRSNFEDNVDLNAKLKVLEGGLEVFPVEVAVLGGLAWNTEVFETEGAEDNESQAYAQLIVNASLGERVAVGLVPTYLRNPRIRDVDAGNAFVLGINGQAYLTDAISFLAEWIVSEERPGLEHDAGTFGFEIETRGHFFKVLFTNQARMNPSQYLAGTPTSFEPDAWRFGFNITRVLPF
jgi:hypothetical protein